MSRIDTRTDLPRFEFLAGRLSLDFCNSRSRPTGGDRLRDAVALAGWAARLGRPLEGQQLAASAVADLQHLRSQLSRLFDAVIDREVPVQADLDALAAANAAPTLRWDPATGRAIAEAPGDALARLRHDIAVDAVALLTDGNKGRLKRCPGPDCGWFFFDTSRNGKRRWCAMADCGTRAKVRHYRDRQQGT